ncbi:MAG TPA: PAS domain-containing protein [Segetibacter sp.]
MINSVQEYRAVFEAMPGVCTLLKANRPEYTIMVVTDAYVAMVGMSRETLCGSGLFDLFPINPDADDTTGEMNVRTSFEYVIRNKKEHHLKAQRYDLPNPDGTFTEKYWQANNKPVLNDGGEVAYIIHYLVDVTDKVKAAQIHKSTKLGDHVYELFMQAPMAICILKGKDFVIELANGRILEIWRKDRNVVGKAVLDALPEIKVTAFPQLLTDVLETGKPFYANESHAYFIKDGKEELVYFNFVYQPYFEDKAAEASGVLAVAYEVTEQVIARKKAEESEQRYRTLIAEAVVATGVYTGREMRIQYANAAMLKLWGKDETVIGTILKDALPELEGQAFDTLLDNVYTTGETYWGKEDKAEIEINGKLQTFYFNFTYKALRNAEGEIYGILNMAIDVTDHVLAQQKLRENEVTLQRIVEERTNELARKNEQLEYSNEELQQFAYVASHDLQEPLRKIRTFSDILSKQVEPEAAIRKYVDKINGSAERMSGLINSLLEYSRLSKGAQRFEKVNLNDILKPILSDYELLINQKNALIVVDTLPNIQAIPLQINQLFYNLIGNALKFTKRNIQPVISIKAELLTDNERIGFKQLEREKQYIKLMVQDNGIGFEQNYADQIFTIFQRLNDKTVFGGYGIGLALCKKVTDTHKGIILAEGKLKEGAKFTVILPVKH